MTALITRTRERRKVTAADVSEAAYVLSRSRKHSRGGRPVELYPCPLWCGYWGGGSTRNMPMHLPRCELNQDPDHFYGTQDWAIEWQLLGTFRCPVGCGKHLPYPKMLRHIPNCEKQSPIEPYTAAKWIKTVGDLKLWPETHLRCPVCSRYEGSYRQVLEHLPACPKQNTEAKVSPNRWRLMLLDGARTQRRRKKEG